jgi:O-succinylbenzoic acid--CoA ligase
MLTIKEQEAIIAIIQPRLIITNWKERERFDSISYPLLCIEEILISSGNDSVIKNDHENKVDDVCAIILTSGSTGIPKAVQLTYGNFEISCKNWNNFLQFESGDQFLCCLPLHHIGGFAVLCRALIYGFSINLVSIFEAQAVFDAISCHPVTIISLVPTMLKRILEIEGGKEALKTMRHILLGGGPSPKSLLDICIQERLSIVKVYGMTETCSGTFGLKLLEEPQNKFYTGRPFPKTTVLIKNDEIHISGPMVMKGYLGERNTNGTHNSHDLGRLDDDLLFLHIRRKDLIVSGGENINPLEVEECLLSVNGISDAAVVGKADDEWGQKITAYIVLKSTPLEKESLNSELKKLLSPYKIPKDYIQVSHIPRNELGKIKYDKLKAL